MADLYNRDILRLASALVSGDAIEMAHGTAQANSRSCGSRITADVNLDNRGMIKALAFRANACAIGQASAAILRSNGIGKTVGEISKTRREIEAFLLGQSVMPNHWPDLGMLCVAKPYPARHAAILLPYDALLAAIESALQKAA